MLWTWFSKFSDTFVCSVPKMMTAFLYSTWVFWHKWLNLFNFPLSSAKDPWIHRFSFWPSISSPHEAHWNCFHWFTLPDIFCNPYWVHICSVWCLRDFSWVLQFYLLKIHITLRPSYESFQSFRNWTASLFLFSKTPIL